MIKSMDVVYTVFVVCTRERMDKPHFSNYYILSKDDSLLNNCGKYEVRKYCTSSIIQDHLIRVELQQKQLAKNLRQRERIPPAHPIGSGLVNLQVCHITDKRSQKILTVLIKLPYFGIMIESQ